VNVAARLCDLADPGHVLGTPAVADALPPWGAVLGTDDIVVRGLENKLRVVRIGFAALHGPVVPDPICGIPLTLEVVAVTTKDSLGRELWFCSDSCRDTWERRPEPPADDLGSPRRPLIGF
jgi:YHS domain-containing protein